MAAYLYEIDSLDEGWFTIEEDQNLLALAILAAEKATKAAGGGSAEVACLNENGDYERAAYIEVDYDGSSTVSYYPYPHYL